MPTRLVFEDDNQELNCYINDKGLVYIEVGPKNQEEPGYQSGFITLDKDDVEKLIQRLSSLKDEMS